MNCLKGDRIGEQNYNSQGYLMTIIKYTNANNIIIEFEKPYKCQVRCCYSTFKKGMVRNPNISKKRNKKDRVGETNVNKQGYLMKIIQYNGYDDITIELDNENKTQIKTTYKSFKNGTLKYIENRLGQTNYNFQGCLMKIVEYNNFKDVIIEFQDEYKFRKHIQYHNFLNGSTKNPFYKSVLNVGFLGTDRVVYYEKAYKHWYDMLKRCYDEKFKKEHLSYNEAIVCDEWLNYENFKKWFDKNYYQVDNEEMQLDKDILIKNNKIYSPLTCTFTPKRINTLFIRKEKKNNLPIGVVKRNKNGKYQVTTKTLGYLGTYNTIEEAFDVYKKAKEKHIKKIADEYKDKIPLKLYKAMYNYQVEITD